MKSHTMRISKYIRINQIFWYVDVQMYIWQARKKQVFWVQKHYLYPIFYLFSVPIGPELTLFNTQTPFYMIQIWYLDLEKKKTRMWIYALNAYIIIGFICGFGKYKRYCSYPKRIGPYPNETV